MANVNSTGSVSDPFAAMNAAGKSSTASSAVEDPQNRFLKLLVTQLKNQDPLNPLDNAQMTSQLAQMSTVTGIERLNSTLNALVDSVGSNQSMQAASIIGKHVMVPGERLPLVQGNAVAGINLAASADQVTVKILDAAGHVVQTQKLGAHAAGVYNIAWDGMNDTGEKLPDGNYTFTVEAARGNDAVTVGALQIGTVSALVRSADGFRLDLGALGAVDFKDVQQIL